MPPPQKQNLLTLNNYNYSDENIAAVIHYLKTENLPPDLTPLQKRTFIRRYGNDRFHLGPKNTLIFTSLGLQSIPTSQKENILKQLYNDMKISPGLGIVGLYNKVCQKYIGIRRNDVRDFLSRQETYQLTRAKRPSINRTTIAKYPNHRWQIDLLDVSTYEGYNKKQKYVLTVIDVFSRYVFARGICNKTPAAIMKALEYIHTHQSQKTWPIILQSDNGTEFKNEKMKSFCERNLMQQVFTPSHTPTSNALIENFNLHFRRIIRDIFVRTKTLNWESHLNEILHNRNHTKNTTATKQIPANIWTPTRTSIPETATIETAKENNINTSIEQKQAIVKKRIESRALANVERFKETVLEIGHKVRVLLAAISSEIRDKIKRGNVKTLAIKFSPQIYTVTRVIHSRNQMQKMQYNIDGFGSKRFYRNELLAVENDAKEVENLDIKKINRLIPSKSR